MVDFRDLKIWAHAHKLALDIHDITTKFPIEEKYDTVSQLRRASESIAANIAEGSARRTDKDFRKFLYNSISSVSEVKYYLLFSRDKKFISEEDYLRLEDQASHVMSMLNRFIRALNKRIKN